MDWPAWITEGRVAIGISLVTAVFTGVYTRRLAINDTNKMKRKEPVLEALLADSENFEGWKECRVTVRNLEAVSVDIRSISSVSDGIYIHPISDTVSVRTLRSGRVERKIIPPDKLPKQRIVVAEKRLYPLGDALVTMDGATIHSLVRSDRMEIALITRGVRSSTDLRLDWVWADGQAR